MAETAVAHLLQTEAKPFTGADMSTKLKLMGVDVASLGDAHAATPGCLTTVYVDERKGLYKKLVTCGEGKTLLGGHPTERVA